MKHGNRSCRGDGQRCIKGEEGGGGVGVWRGEGGGGGRGRTPFLLWSLGERA